MDPLRRNPCASCSVGRREVMARSLDWCEGGGPKMLRIRDIMTREVFVLPAEASLEEAASSLSSRGIGGAPVRDRRGQLVGVLSKSDLVDPENGTADARTVGDVMMPALLTLHEDDP